MAKSQLTHGFELGANLMNADFVIDDESVNTKFAIGPRAGYVAEYTLSERFYLRGAVLFMQKGFKFANENWAVNSFDLPLGLGLAFDLNGNKLQWFLDGNVSFEYNTRAITKINDEPVELIIGKNEGEIKAVSSGIDIGTGIHFSQMIKFRINYYFGLTNIINTPSTDKWKNQYLGLSLNFLFRK